VSPASCDRFHIDSNFIAAIIALMQVSVQAVSSEPAELARGLAGALADLADRLAEAAHRLIEVSDRLARALADVAQRLTRAPA
jgi:hypothetical protein